MAEIIVAIGQVQVMMMKGKGKGQTRSAESGAWYRAGARSLTSKLKRLIYSMWPGEFLDRGISNNKSRLG